MEETEMKIVELVQELKRFIEAFVNNDFGTCTRLLCEIKVMLTEYRSLPPLFEATPTIAQELNLARSLYEYAVFLSVKMRDQEAFERDFRQLKPYYTDIRAHIPRSAQEYQILGLNLLRLLVQNRIAEFHTELELLSHAALQHRSIKYAIEMEQAFMEGAYTWVMTSRRSLPHETYGYFVNSLAKRMRDEISASCEKAYDNLSVDSAREILLFPFNTGLFKYIREERPKWQISNGIVFFPNAKDSEEIPSRQLINQTIFYASELERIV